MQHLSSLTKKVSSSSIQADISTGADTYVVLRSFTVFGLNVKNSKG